MTRGFVTIATGKTFYPLAQHLMVSYKRNGSCDLPFYVLTDEGGVSELEGYFDKVIVIDNPYHSYLDKLTLAEYVPFDETIFIDADSTIIKDVSYIWSLVDAIESPVSVIGFDVDSDDNRYSPAFHRELLNKINAKWYPGFNGGVYIIKNVMESKIIFREARNALSSYFEYGMPTFRNGAKGDEPVMQYAMAKYKCHSIDRRDFMICLVNYRDFNISVLEKKCSVIKNDIYREPAILHWGTELTQISPLYRMEDMKLRKNREKLTVFELLYIYSSTFIVRIQHKIKNMVS